jgi:integrase
MPTIAFTDRSISALKPRGAQTDYFDRSFPGLALRVNPTGRKTWALFHRVNGRLRRLTLREPDTDASTYPTVSLARARELARAALQSSSIGVDPTVEQQLRRERTFGALADEYLEKHAKRMKRSWRADGRMIRIELKTWRDRPIATIRRIDVRELLDNIVERGAPVLANRVLALVRKILNYGLDREWVEANVAAKMSRAAAEQSRTRVLTVEEIRQVWAWLERDLESDDQQADRLAALNQAALKLRLITAQRGGEVVNMRWADVDLRAWWWTIPAEHAKNKLPHRVPLSPLARGVLKRLRKNAAADATHVFAGIRGTNHRHGALKGISVSDLRPHDFRRTAASLMAGGGIPRLTIAKILNHVDRSVTAIYDRHSYDAEKRAALDWWGRRLSAIIDGTDRKVLPFVRRRHNAGE